jgi:DNA-directed RNA polymerase subunit RPC12/RpoP
MWVPGTERASGATDYLGSMATRGRARGMQHVSVAPPLLLLESFVDCSKSIIIDCRCGEKLLLLGRESDWGKEGRTAFECSGCGKKLSLKDAR